MLRFKANLSSPATLRLKEQSTTARAIHPPGSDHDHGDDHGDHNQDQDHGGDRDCHDEAAHTGCCSPDAVNGDDDGDDGDDDDHNAYVNEGDDEDDADVNADDADEDDDYAHTGCCSSPDANQFV